MLTRKKKHARRKLTEEKVDAINRKRDLLLGSEESFEDPREEVARDESGRPVLRDTRRPWA